MSLLDKEFSTPYFSKLVFLTFIFELDKDNEYLKEECWQKANPNIGVSVTKEYIRKKVERAKNDIASRPGILTKHFDLTQSTSKAYFDLKDLKNEEAFRIEDMKNRYCIIGIDLSATTDLTCITFDFPFTDKHYIEQMYFLPEGKLERKIEEDKKPLS